MSAPTNTVTTATSIGLREDLEDNIYRVAPEETPIIANIGKGKATAIKHEWQLEALATPNDSNAALEGDDITSFDTPNTTVRVGNLCQIFRKTVSVSRTEEVVDKAGRASEINRQTVLKGIENRRDMEARFARNLAAQSESGANPRMAAGLLAWLTSNVSRGTGGSSGSLSGGVPTTAATNGTQRGFTESLVKSVLASAFANGARPSLGFMGGPHKQVFSTFTGIADIRVNADKGKQANIIAGADVYTSDFGNITLMPHPYAYTRDAVFIDPKMLAVGVLDGTKRKRLGDSGDSEKYLMTNESTLIVRNERAHAVVADLL